MADILKRGVMFTSYPRSGSNWLRTILSNVLENGSNPYQLIKSPGDAPPFPNLPFGQESLPYIKTHLCLRRFGEVFMDTAAIITIHRHPLDVLLSSLNYLYKGNVQTGIFAGRELRPLEDIIDLGEIDYYIDMFCADNGVSNFKGRCGTYSSYHQDLNQYEGSIINFKYESFFAHKENGIDQLADFIGQKRELDSHTILKYADSFTERKMPALNRESYNYKKFLNKTQIKRFYSKYGETIAAMGYE